MLRIVQLSGLAGGGRSLPVPRPLAQRQRRRYSMKWIITASAKRRDGRLAHRVAQELIAVAEGRSGVWDKRDQTHKMATATRSNLDVVESRRRLMNTTTRTFN